MKIKVQICSIFFFPFIIIWTQEKIEITVVERSFEAKNDELAYVLVSVIADVDPAGVLNDTRRKNSKFESCFSHLSGISYQY